MTDPPVAPPSQEPSAETQHDPGPGAPEQAGVNVTASADADDDMAKLKKHAVALGLTVGELLTAMEEMVLEQQTRPAHNPTTPVNQEQTMIDPTQGGAPGAGPAQPTGGAAPAPTPQPPAPTPGASARTERSRALDEHTRRRIQREREEMKRARSSAEQERDSYRTRHQDATRALAVQREEEAIKLDLVRAGVQDLDGAWYFFTNELKQLRADTSPEGVEKLNAFLAAGGAGWAQAIRAQRSYLFGTTAQPANTGAPTLLQNQPPAAPRPGAVTGQAADAAGKFDFRTASPEEAKKRMASLGITHTFGRTR
jgi:hypothetical protein